MEDAGAEDAKVAEARHLPYNQRLADKNWKIRRDAYEDIKGACNGNSQPDGSYGSLLAKGVGDANAAAQDAALDALLCYLNAGTEAQAEKIAEHACSAIASKVLKQRATTVSKATDVSMAFVEQGQGELMLGAIVVAFEAKLPKAVQAAAGIVEKAVSCFGLKVIPAKPLLAALPKLYDSKTGPVREIAKSLTVTVSQWLGQGVVNDVLLSKMSDIMRKEVEKAVKEAPVGRPQPSRFTRKDSAAREAASMQVFETAYPSDTTAVPAPANHVTIAEADDPEVDAYDISSAVDILPDLRGWDEEMASTAKWSTRRDLLKTLRGLAETPRLEPSDFGDILRRLKIVISKDSNVVCVAEAVACIGALAKGLRTEFSSAAKNFVPLLLDKLKDKSPGVWRNCTAALGTLHKYCCTLNDVADDYAVALACKLPKAKVQTMNVLTEALGSSPKKDASKLQVLLAPLLATAAMEAAPEVREAALQALVAFYLAAGEPTKLARVTDKALDEKRQKALSELIAAARPTPSSLSAAPVAAAAPAPQPSRATSAQASQVNSASSTPRKAPAGAMPPQPRPRVKRTASSIVAGAARDDDAATPSGSMDKAAAEERLDGLFGNGTCTALASAAWKERLEAITRIADQLTCSDQQGKTSVQCQTDLIECMAHLPGWSDKNFQVTAKMLHVVTAVASSCSTVGRREAASAVGGFVERMSDSKLRSPASSALTALSEAVGPQFIATQLHNKAAAQKSPKVLVEVLDWLSGAIREFGLAQFDTKKVVGWCTDDLTSREAAVRTAAVGVMASAHCQVGPPLAAMVRPEVKPALMVTLEEAFAANPLSQVDVTRHVRGEAVPTSNGLAKGRTLPNAEEPPTKPEADLPDLCPRTDISSQMTEELLKKLGSANWKDRAAALDAVHAAIRGAGGRISPALGDLTAGLKARLADANKNLIQRTLLLMGELGKAMGPAIERVARTCYPPAIQCLGDKKKPIRDAVIAMLEDWVGEGGRVPPEKLATAVFETLSGPKMSPEGRVAAVTWLGATCSSVGHTCRCLDMVLRTALFCASDKSSEVRKAGEAMMLSVIADCGDRSLVKAAGSMPGRERGPAKELLAKYSVHPQPTAAAATAPAAITAGASATNNGPPAGGGPQRPHSAQPPQQFSVPQSAAAVQEEEFVPLLQVSARKDSRLRQMRFKGGKWDGLRKDEEDSLKAELTPLASPALCAALFGKDFRCHVEAVDILSSSLEDNLEAVVSVLDLLFRWIVLRICEANTQCHVKVADLAKLVLDALYEQEYKLAEAEAQILLPCLVEKAGHGQERIRSLHRELLLQACGLFESQRVCEFLVLGLASVNNRTRIEAIEVLADMIGQEGIIVYQGARYKPLPAVAQLVTDRDRGVRAAALQLLAITYQQEGTALWRLLGKLSSQQRSLVEERLKSTDKQAAQQGLDIGYKRAEREGRSYSEYGDDVADVDHHSVMPSGDMGREMGHAQPGQPSQYGDAALGQGHYGEYTGRPPLRDGRYPEGSEAAYPNVFGDAVGGFHSRTASVDDYESATSYVDQGISAEYVHTPPRAPLHAAPQFTYAPTPGAFQPSAIGLPTPAPAPTPAQYAQAFESDPLRSDAEVEAEWEHGLALLNHDQAEKQVDGIKLLGGQLSEAMEGRISAVSEARCARDADAMVGMLSKRLRLIFKEAFAIWERTHQPAPHRRCKYTVSLLMRVWSLSALARSVAVDTLREFVAAMLLTLVDPRVLEIQEGGNLMKALNVLMLKALENCNRTAAFTALLKLTRDAPADVKDQPDATARFFDLAVKCLIKISKALSDDLQEIQCGTVLLAVDDFFRQLGLAEIRLRSGRDDKPLRMVKTLLHELCKKKGMAILEDMHAISEDEPLPIIRAYIDLNLLTLHQAGLISGPLPLRIAARVESLNAGSGTQPRATPALSSSSWQAPLPSRSIQQPLPPGALPQTHPSQRLPTPSQLPGASQDEIQHRQQQQHQQHAQRHQQSSGGEERSVTVHREPSPASLRENQQELKLRLVAALDQLGSGGGGAGSEGMEALHDWLHMHPELNLDAFLVGANERLKVYFYQELRAVAARRQGGRYGLPLGSDDGPEGGKTNALCTPATKTHQAPPTKVNSVEVLKERLNRLPVRQAAPLSGDPPL